MELHFAVQFIKFISRNFYVISLVCLGFCITGCEPNPRPTAPCSSEQLTPGLHQCGFWVDDNLRWYEIYIPTDAGNAALPLVVDLHGAASPITFGSSAQRFAVSHFDITAEKYKFVVIWPQGINMIWLNDQKFVLDLIAEIQQLLNINARKIYATGVSNGGAFSQDFGCNHADVFAAVAPVAAPVARVFPCGPSNPMPVFTVHAATDWLVAYKGTPLFLSAPETFELWSEVDGCVDEAEVVLQQGGSTCWLHDNCNGGVQVKTCKIDSHGLFLGGHLPYMNNDGLNISEMIWQFFDQYERY